MRSGKKKKKKTEKHKIDTLGVIQPTWELQVPLQNVTLTPFLRIVVLLSSSSSSSSSSTTSSYSFFFFFSSSSSSSTSTTSIVRGGLLLRLINRAASTVRVADVDIIMGDGIGVAETGC